MKITVLGAGAMGSLFGGYLSRHNDVSIIDINASRVEAIMRNGIIIDEAGSTSQYWPVATASPQNIKVDLVLVLVKAMHTDEALSQNQHLLTENTYIMTLQNGIGHEAVLLKYADRDHVIIGITQHNSSVIDDGHIRHGGSGRTIFGLLDGKSARVQHIADEFNRCGFESSVSDEIQTEVWKKLFLNTAASSLTAVLQVPLGFILQNRHAFFAMEQLTREAVMVANAVLDTEFDPETVINDIKSVLSNANECYTSIYIDLKNGVHSEVDFISGAVVSAARRLDIKVPCHELLIYLIHAVEGKIQKKRPTSEDLPDILAD